MDEGLNAGHQGRVAEVHGADVQPGDDMKIVKTNHLDDGFMASPALDGSALYLRTRSHVYRIENTP